MTEIKWKLSAYYINWKTWRLGLTHHQDVAGWERYLNIGPLTLVWQEQQD